MTRLLRATLPLLLAACPARAPLRPDPTIAARPPSPPGPCVGTAQRSDGRTLTLRADGAVLAGERVVLRVETDAVTDGHGRRLATRDDRSLRLVDGDRALTLDDTSMSRDDGLRAQVDPNTGALSVTNPSGESARAPWTLQCARGTWSLGCSCCWCTMALNLHTPRRHHESSPGEANESCVLCAPAAHPRRPPVRGVHAGARRLWRAHGAQG